MESINGNCGGEHLGLPPEQISRVYLPIAQKVSEANKLNMQQIKNR